VSRLSFGALLLLTLMFGNNSVTVARSDRAPPILLEKAVAAYKLKGVNSFLPILLGSPLAVDSHHNFLTILNKVEIIYGKYIGLEMVDTLTVSGSTRIVFFIMQYQRGPLYGVLTVYEVNGKESITGFKVHTEIHHVIPESILSKL